ncbi:hypothetical protein HHK36_009054 [Tetracentron sinense]|uniref:Uncharacterized protein n=1 Tax=Tetracentron sinense TaxID=13715 RepID=A0A834ZB36_TETSI|nr:hypothetical protein HHK36_009054 [Tetracentron sinense]
MERNEPTLVPEWSKNSGSVTRGGRATHNVASSSSHSDNHAVARPTRNRTSVSFSDYDALRSPTTSDRISSSYFRRSSSSNGSMTHDKDPSAYSRSYSSFSRSHRDREWAKDSFDYCEHERSVLRDHRDHDYHDPLANIPTSRVEKDALGRSQLMLGKRGEVWPKRGAADSNSGTSGNHNSSNGPLAGGRIVSSHHKATFERDFPSLGTEERQVTADIGRVPSPGLSAAVQSLVNGTSTVIGGDGWTSALAEVPIIVGGNSMGLSSVQQTAAAGSASVASSTMTGLNMAETLAHAPSRARTTPQLSVETQRIEELAIKKSRQLVPMTPSMPKALVSPSDKAKSKTASRTGEMSVATKIGQQQQLSSSHLANHSLRGGPVRSDVSMTSHVGKLHILKPAREKIGVSSSANDGLSPTNNSRVVNSPLAVAPPLTVAPPAAVVSLRSPNNPKLANAEHKSATVAATRSSVVKRPTMSQAQSRNDFFNLMRKKTSTNLSSAAPDPSSVVPSPILDNSGELIEEVPVTPVSPQCSDTPSSDPSDVYSSTENGGDITCNGDACEGSHTSSTSGEKHEVSVAVIYPDEKEAALLRLLGWDGNVGEEGGLTEEEISAFYQAHRKLKPSLKLCRGMQPNLSMPLESHEGSLGGASSGESSSSDSES